METSYRHNRKTASFAIDTIANYRHFLSDKLSFYNITAKMVLSALLIYLVYMPSLYIRLTRSEYTRIFLLVISTLQNKLCYIFFLLPNWLFHNLYRSLYDLACIRQIGMQRREKYYEEDNKTLHIWERHLEVTKNKEQHTKGLMSVDVLWETSRSIGNFNRSQQTEECTMKKVKITTITGLLAKTIEKVLDEQGVVIYRQNDDESLEVFTETRDDHLQFLMDKLNEGYQEYKHKHPDFARVVQ